MSVSVLILTFNEELNLEECLRSLAWCDDIVVFDSFSTDSTTTIARAHGARVYQRRFDNYAAQRTAGLESVQYRHPWVLMVDADERVPTELAKEIRAAVVSADAGTAIFRMRRKDYIFGRWLRRSSGYPTWFGRLVRLGRVRIEREVNEEYLTDGGVVHLREHLEHHPFNKGMAWWFERHNRYSTMEAAAVRDSSSQALRMRSIFSGDAIARRRALKQLAYRLPGRPLLVFMYLYVARGGVLDGRAGLNFCLMRASYEMMIDLKVRELTAKSPRTES